MKLEQVFIEFSSANSEIGSPTYPFNGVGLESHLSRGWVDPRTSPKIRLDLRKTRERVRLGGEGSGGVESTFVPVDRLPAARRSLANSPEVPSTCHGVTSAFIDHSQLSRQRSMFKPESTVEPS